MSWSRPRQLPLFPLISLTAVEAQEKRLGFLLPTLLTEMYTQVGNGGFGPGYGIYGLEGGFLRKDPRASEDDPGASLVDYYLACRPSDTSLADMRHDFKRDGSLFYGEALWENPGKLIEICSWGCDQYSCIDCSQANTPVMLLIAYGGELKLQRDTFVEWIEDWLDGGLHL
jgi:hypothetical protein